jgi:hypothetical protein
MASATEDISSRWSRDRSLLRNPKKATAFQNSKAKSANQQQMPDKSTRHKKMLIEDQPCQ